MANPEEALEHETLPIPELDYRWVHTGSQYLDLLPTPITTAATAYKAFSLDESFRIEEAWNALTPEERLKSIHDWGRKEGEGFATPASKKDTAKDKDKDKDKDKERRGSNASARSVNTNAGKRDDGEMIRSGEEQPHDEEKDSAGKYKDIMAKAQQEYENLELIAGVPVSQDSLFEVSLKTLSLHPAFWAHAGPRVSVLRGSWFVTDETKPCSWDFAEELEKGYKEIEPWQPSYKHELATAIALGSAAEEKLKYTLPARFGSLGVIFEDADKARLLTTGALNYLPRQFFSFRGRGSGTMLYRGYSAAAAARGTRSRSESQSRRASSNSQRPDKPEPPTGRPRSMDVFEEFKDGADKLKEGASRLKDGAGKLREGADRLGQEGLDKLSGKDKKAALQEEMSPLVDAEESDTPCTDLILVIHGIGQQLAAQYEAYNFVYAGNQLRQSLRKQSTNPALSSIIRDRRVQVLPVQWRALLTFEHEQSEEDQQHDMDNRFTMGDITLNKSIPYVRELTNSVLLDIPLFMSPHRQKMIEAVCLQANKLYRLWVARNPDFDKNGRVHIIGHSLGSALAAHILSNQPTKMPGLHQLPKQVITKTRDRFIFNTSNLFLCGSPLGIFLHLDQAQLMPRKARERTMNSPQDEALDRAGKFGCMAIDSLYNVFYPTDPIAYMLNAAVDSKLAATRQPLAITSVTAGLYATVTEGFGSISRYMPSLPAFMPGSGANGTPEKKALRPGAIRLPSGIEMLGSKGEEKLEGSRGERRFSALNPHGNIDFYLTSAGVNEYLDMITAHASYWTDASFAAFLLAETYSTRLDLMRTGMGLAEQVLPEGTTI